MGTLCLKEAKIKTNQVCEREIKETAHANKEQNTSKPGSRTHYPYFTKL